MIVLGLGVDIVEIDRMKQALERDAAHQGAHLLGRRAVVLRAQGEAVGALRDALRCQGGGAQGARDGLLGHALLRRRGRARGQRPPDAEAVQVAPPSAPPSSVWSRCTCRCRSRTRRRSPRRWRSPRTLVRARTSGPIPRRSSRRRSRRRGRCSTRWRLRIRARFRSKLDGRSRAIEAARFRLLEGERCIAYSPPLRPEPSRSSPSPSRASHSRRSCAPRAPPSLARSPSACPKATSSCSRDPATTAATDGSRRATCTRRVARCRVLSVREPDELSGIAADAAREAIAAGVPWSAPAAPPTR